MRQETLHHRSPVTNPIISLRDVSLAYGEHSVFEHLDLDIPAGQWLSITGDNASGKTSLARIIAGLVPPSSGYVKLLDYVVHDHTSDAQAYRHARQHIGMVFQQPGSQLVARDMVDDVAFAPENLGVPPEAIERRVIDALATVGLPSKRSVESGERIEHTQRDPSRLSGGQQQRLALAGMLAKQPQILVLDEASSMLDPLAHEQLMRSLLRVHSQGVTIVQISHRAQDAQYAQRVIRIAQGRIVHDDCVDKPAQPADHEFNRTLQHPHAVDPAVVRSNSALSTPAVRIHDLNVSYGSRQVLQHVNLQADYGSCTLIVGANGSGKSTVAKTLAGLLPDSDHAIERLARDQHPPRIGYVMQHPEHQLFAHTVFDDVAYGLRQDGIDEDEVRQQVHQILQALHIDHLSARSPFALSGGQQRLVAMAGILVLQPDILILDEPSAYLDQAARERMIELIDQLRSQGLCLLVISHDPDEVAVLADQVFDLDQQQSRQVCNRPDTGKEPQSSPTTGQEDLTLGSQPPALAERMQRASALVQHPERTFLERCDPRTLIICSLSMIACMFALHSWNAIAIAALVSLASIAGSRTPVRSIVKVMLALLPLLIMMALLNMAVTQTGNTVVGLSWLRITDDGLHVSGIYMARLVCASIIGWCAWASMSPTRIADAWYALAKPTQRWGWHPQEVSLILSLSLTFLPILLQDYRDIRLAQRTRIMHAPLPSSAHKSISLSQRMRRKLDSMLGVIVPLVAAAVRHADTLALALQARSYEPGMHRSHYPSLRITTRDWLLTACTLSAIVLMLVLGLLA